MNKTTSNEYEKIRIIKARTGLILSSPFFASLAMRLRLVEDGRIPTFATDGLRLLYNPKFSAQLTDGMLKGVVAHEILHACFPGETLIMTRKGLQHIACVKPGDYVYSKTGCFTKVTGIGSRPYEGEIIEIQPSYGLKFAVTPEHPVLSLRLPKPLTRHLRRAHGIPAVIDRYVRNRGNIRFRPAGELNRDTDFLLFPLPNYEDSKKKRLTILTRIRRHYVYKKVRMNEKTAYFLGWFVGDGSLHMPNQKVGQWFGPSAEKREIYVTLALHDPHAELKALIEQEFHRSVSVVDLHPKKAIRLVFSSTGLARYLRKHFVDNEGNKTIPSWMLAMPGRIIKAFIRGLEEADGYQHETAHSISNTALGVIGMVPLLLTRLGENPTLTFHPEYEDSHGRHANSYKVNWWESKSSQRRGGVRRGMYRVIPIKSIKREPYDNLVYNLETHDHTYCLPFLTVHNCALHPMRRGARHWFVYNLAADAVVNPIVIESKMELPPGCFMEDRFKGMYVEQVYNILMKEVKFVKMKGDGGCGSVIDPTGEDGEVLSPAEQKALEEDWKVATQQAEANAKAAGNTPGNIERMVTEAQRSKVDWREILRPFVTASMCPKDYQWHPPNRRFIAQGLYLPSVKKEGIGPIDVHCDASGSIDQDMYNQWSAEINSIVQETRPEMTRVIYFDTRVQHVDEFGPDDTVVLTVRAGGGTDFRPSFQWAQEHDTHPVCAIVLTDLECNSYPEPPEYPVLFATPSDHTAKFGTTVRLEDF